MSSVNLIAQRRQYIFIERNFVGPDRSEAALSHHPGIQEQHLLYFVAFIQNSQDEFVVVAKDEFGVAIFGHHVEDVVQRATALWPLVEDVTQEDEPCFETLVLAAERAIGDQCNEQVFSSVDVADRKNMGIAGHERSPVGERFFTGG
jgi:hypothetical protein